MGSSPSRSTPKSWAAPWRATAPQAKPRSYAPRASPWYVRVLMAAPQHEKADRFQALHRSGMFIMPNAWDGGSARVLGGIGFGALATSSGASAATLGRLDGTISRDEALAHARVIVAATDLPV